MAVEAKERVGVEIPKPRITLIKLKIRNLGDSSILQNRFSEDAGASIKNNELKKPKDNRKPKDPIKIFNSAMYKTATGETGVPAKAVKASMVAAAKIAGEKMTDMRKAFHVMGDIIPFTKHSKPVKREDFLPNPNSGGNRNWRIRAEIGKWELDVPIKFNANFISADQLANLLSLAGFHCGLLDDRPNSKKCSGNHGMFEIATKQKK